MGDISKSLADVLDGCRVAGLVYDGMTQAAAEFVDRWLALGPAIRHVEGMWASGQIACDETQAALSPVVEPGGLSVLGSHPGSLAPLLTVHRGFVSPRRVGPRPGGMRFTCVGHAPPACTWTLPRAVVHHVSNLPAHVVHFSPASYRPNWLSMSSENVRLSGQGKCPSRLLPYHRTVVRGT